MKQWIVCDIDGTLAGNDHLLAEETIQTMALAQAQGIGLVLASGRSPYSMQYYANALALEQYEGIGICFNGAIVYDFKTKLMLSEKTIPNATLRKSIALGKQMGLQMAVYCGNQIFSEVQNVHLTGGAYQKSKYQGIEYVLVDDLEELACDAHKLAAYLYDVEVWDKLIVPQGNPLNFVRVNPTWIEMNPAHVSKGDALHSLIATKNINLDHLVVFGDGENDISMFAVAKHRVAMANAFPSLKAMASDVTASNEQCGVAKYVMEHMLSKK